MSVVNMLGQSVLYDKLPVGETETLVVRQRKQRRTAPKYCVWLAHAVLLTISLSCLTVSYRLSQATTSASWSTPGFDHFSRKDVKFNGSFHSSSPYRGPPSPEVDAAWDRFTANPWIDGTATVLGVGHTAISHARKASAGDWFNSTVRLGEDLGEPTLMGTLEMFHQLHCLDMIRKFTHLGYYEDKVPAFQISGDDRRHHVDHCIEIIRQVIMCNGDTNLITWHWVKNKPNPYPDFNVWHSCRDPEEILALSKEKQFPLMGKDQIQKKNHKNIVEMPYAP